MRALLVIGVLSVVMLLVVACESNARVSESGALAGATPASASPQASPAVPPGPSPSSSSAGPDPASTPTPVPTPAATPLVTAVPASTPTPEPSATTWRSVSLRPETTNGGADVAVGGDGRVHVVTANLEDSWGPFWYDDASVYTNTRGGAGKLRKGALVGGTSPLITAHAADVWIAYHAYACGAIRYGDVGGIGLDHSADAGRSWGGTRCLTWGRNGPTTDAGSPRAVASAKGVVYVAGPQHRSDLTAWISRDGGNTWARTMLARKPQIGWSGRVFIAAAGDRAVIAWESRGKVKARTTRDAGRTWSKTEVMPLADLDGAAGRGGRIALWGGATNATTLLTWTTRHGWASQQLPDAAWAGGEPNVDLFSGSLLVALGPGRQLALVGSGAGCTYDEDEDTVSGVSTWQWSLDNGTTWSDPIAVAGCRSAWDAELVIGADGRPYILQEDGWGYELLIGPRTRYRA